MSKSVFMGAWRQAAIALLFAAALPLATGSLPLAGTVLIFAIAAAACSLLLGHAGLLSFAQGTFFGIGSYTTALLLKAWPQMGWAALLPAAACAGAAALAISLLAARQKGIYFVMITLAMAQLVYFMALSFPGVTGGENGLIDIPRPDFLAMPGLDENQAFYLACCAIFVLVFWLLGATVRSSFGQALDAVRQNEVRAQTLGFNVRLLKVQAFCVSGAATAVAGGLYALQLRSAPLSSIDLAMSESILIMAILGGRRTLTGAAFGALAMLLMSEHLSAIWPRWQLVVGAVLVMTVLYAPDGLGGLWLRAMAWFARRPAWRLLREEKSAPVEIR